MALRTKLLALTNVSTTDGNKLIYTPPPDNTGLVKSIQVANENLSATTVTVLIQNLAGTERAYVMFESVPASTIRLLSGLFLVIPPTHKLTISTTVGLAGQTRVGVHGAQLAGVAS